MTEEDDSHETSKVSQVMSRQILATMLEISSLASARIPPPPREGGLLSYPLLGFPPVLFVPCGQCRLSIVNIRGTPLDAHETDPGSYVPPLSMSPNIDAS